MQYPLTKFFLSFSTIFCVASLELGNEKFNDMVHRLHTFCILSSRGLTCMLKTRAWEGQEGGNLQHPCWGWHLIKGERVCTGLHAGITSPIFNTHTWRCSLLVWYIKNCMDMHVTVEKLVLCLYLKPWMTGEVQWEGSQARRQFWTWNSVQTSWLGFITKIFNQSLSQTTPPKSNNLAAPSQN